ncbi:MAG TPA: PilZ domain-containing protein [Dongiaceae bacterium]|nr:PilZ domain-containing protein [Dongiaceae bacterium]
MPELMQNRRNTPRASLIAVIEVTEVQSGTHLTARTSDISRTGCYVDTLNPTPSGTDVRVKITHAGQVLEAPARVVYTSPRLGMGLRFDENLAPGQRAILEQWLGPEA